jgi:uncharacterized protein
MWPAGSKGAVTRSSALFDYDELHMTALAAKTASLYCVAFVDRGEVRRIISLRRATSREVKHYVEHI